MKNKRVLLLVGLLASLTAVLAIVHISTREVIPKGTLKIKTSEKTINLPLSELELEEVRGTIVNGKGEETDIEARGILISGLLEQVQISAYEEVTAVADDAYSAAVTSEEIAAPGKVYLIVQEDGGARTIVFGDPNSKRHVSNVVCLQVR